MFTIDFQKPLWYKEAIMINQGNLSANNILRCKVITGGDPTLEGYSGSATFTPQSNKEINGVCRIVDELNCVVDIHFPSNALEVGVGSVEILLVKGSGSSKVTAQSPSIKYEVWQGKTTGSGIQGDNNYPVLVDLIADANNAVRIANNANATATVAITQTGRLIEETRDVIVEANDVIYQTNKARENTVKATTNAENKILDVENRFNKMSSEKQQDAEVIDARDGELSLKARLDRDLYIDDKSLKQEIIDLNGLKESQDMAYSTDKGYLVCKNIKNGSVKDLVVKGRTLVNMIPKNSWTLNSVKFQVEYIPFDINGKQITVYNFTDKKIVFEYNTQGLGVSGTYGGAIDIPYNSKKTIDMNGKYLRIIQARFSDGFTSEMLEKIKSKVVLIESDININGYFEGLKSVGEDVDKIEVLTSNSNLAYNIEVGNINTGNGAYVDDPNSNRLNKVRVTPNTRYIFSKNNVGRPCNKFYYDIQGKFLGSPLDTSYTFATPPNAYYVALTWGGSVEVGQYQLEKGDVIHPYVNSKQDKKPLLYKDTTTNTWKPIPYLTEFDVVDSAKGKWYKRGYKEVFDGSDDENWSVASNLKNVIQFTWELGIPGGKSLGVIICDKFILNHATDTDAEGVSGSASLGSRIYIRINKSKLETQDVAGFKKWLQANNVTVVYQLAREEVYDIAPLNLDAYTDETVIQCASGAISPIMDFKLTSSLANFVKELEDRVSRIEEDFYNMNQANFAIALNALNTKLIVEDMMKTPK